jgi:raffinose/stachyose/melibiose transport system substrate-binding protein
MLNFTGGKIMKKRWLALALTGAMTVSLLTGCGSKSGTTDTKKDTTDDTSSASGKVYYLNFKPEQDKQWKALAKEVQEGNRRPRDHRHRGRGHL